MLNAKGEKAKCSMLNAESILAFSLQPSAFVLTHPARVTPAYGQKLSNLNPTTHHAGL
jgi:hypothetical protein